MQKPAGTILIVVIVSMCLPSFEHMATAFDFYTDTAHGNRSYGVNRSGTGYQAGDCTHCHDTFDQSTCGVNELMFFAPYTSSGQSDNFCFACHRGVGSLQDTVFNNYNYSYMAGGATSITCPGNILEAFSFVDESGSPVLNCGSDYGTSHNLTDIKNFIDGKWGYTADSNPCTACHIPHLVQKDPHTPDNRGWLVSRPSGHADSSTWLLWGDDEEERMSFRASAVEYGGAYQAPFRYSSTTQYEPDGSSIKDGSNLVDYTTFCLDCHSQSVYSTNGVVHYDSYGNATTKHNLCAIEWDWSKHGETDRRGSDERDEVRAPYTSTSTDTINYYLACTDCHEPHGSPNLFLIRQEVNGSSGVALVNGTREAWISLCSRCHYRDFGDHWSQYLCAWCHRHCPPGGMPGL